MKTTARSTVLVTGATSGIGRAASLQFAEAGYRVFATGRNPAALARLAEEASGRMETLVLDVTAARSIAGAREEVLGRTGGHGLDVLVNNAGFGVAAPVELVRDADLRAQFETNVFGLVSVTRAFLPEMRQRGSGRILNVSSINGRFTLPFLGIYDASKYAVESLSDAMRMELAGFGIEVVLIEPGPTRSDFAQRAGAILSTYATGAGPYASQLARAPEIQARFERSSARAESVGRVLVRAAGARRPAARYVTPFAARLLLATFRWLPTRASDWLLRSFMGLHGQRAAAPGRLAQHG